MIKLVTKPGRTTKLLNIAAETNSYIVCHTWEECERLAYLAKETGLDIPRPITMYAFIRGQFDPHGDQGFVVDDVETLLQILAKGLKVHAASFGGVEVRPSNHEEEIKP